MSEALLVALIVLVAGLISEVRGLRSDVRSLDPRCAICGDTADDHDGPHCWEGR